MEEKFSGSVHQMLQGMYVTDAVTNDAFEIQKVLKSFGYKSEIFANLDYVCSECKSKVYDYKKYKDYSSSNNILIYHYATYSVVTGFVLDLPDKIILRYHNVTPYSYFELFDSKLKAEMKRGKDDVLRLREKVVLTMAVSEFNGLDLKVLGFGKILVLPIIIDFEKFNKKYSKEVWSKFQDSHINVIFVGRIAPNKKYEDLLKIFYYFNEINSHSRLILVGSYDFSIEYYHYLKNIIRFLDLSNVIFTGTVTLPELISYYRVSDLFLCMSEHEGFCIPIIEAMYFGIPIIAYNSTGIPYTLKGLGVLINKKKFQETAELMDIVFKDESIRERIVKGQNERLKDFKRENMASLLLEYIETVKKML